MNYDASLWLIFILLGLATTLPLLRLLVPVLILARRWWHVAYHNV